MGDLDDELVGQLAGPTPAATPAGWFLQLAALDESAPRARAAATWREQYGESIPHVALLSR